MSYAADRGSSPNYWNTATDHGGLEPVPDAGLEPSHGGWGDQSQKELYNPAGIVGASDGAGLGAETNQRILGLSVRRFWTILILLVVVIAGAIGGGVGGGLAAASRASSSR